MRPIFSFRLFTLIAVAAAAFAISAPALALDEAGEKARPRHYDIPSPKNSAEAIDVLRKHSDEMAKAYDKRDFSEVHHQSYFLEVAVNKLMEEETFAEEKLTKLEARVQEVHHAAEDGEEKIVDQSFPKLKAEVKDLLESKPNNNKG